MPPFLGCIADDVTGASDLASALTVGGMRTELWFDTSCACRPMPETDAIVIALKTRSVPPAVAVRQTLVALDALQSSRVNRFYYKYCSTFDSTEQGNIGPVAEALMAALHADGTLFCPATPENGRTVYCGHLFVNGRLLNRCGMEHHPLNPMTESDLTQILSRQSKHAVGLISRDIIATAPSAIANAIESRIEQGRPLIIVDAINDGDMETIAAVAARMPFVTGGSGLGGKLPGAYRKEGCLTSLSLEPAIPVATGPTLLLAGSCSPATQAQVANWSESAPSLSLDIAALIRGDLSLTSILDWARTRLLQGSALISSTSSASEVQSLQSRFGVEKTAAAIEETMGAVASTFVAEGIRRLIVAGGETSGAVIRALDIRRFRIGPQIAPGVPWMETVDEPYLAIALKSGNFGQDDFFRTALEMLP
ncbi:four-carbon acid sugar kinase family protein [Blastopirellula sp. J2-11]|uniref:3-oxo-tetronate kinase n=1 Tax=Blastopirellula sp. J2-11 TaxID=2943192 RepID=UPI0021CA09AD|nr:3-oxo-tetronate kinase [Blastopirellula sp. J2-11]UUO04554.1 four-carbon acid sugar kinase family protein [Blastopirellula sp. J2-11]